MKILELVKTLISEEAFELIKDEIEDKEVETIPYSRFKEVNDKKKEMEEKLEKFKDVDLEGLVKSDARLKEIEEDYNTLIKEKKANEYEGIFKELDVKDDFKEFLRFKAGEDAEDLVKFKETLTTYKADENFKKYFNTEDKQDIGFKETKIKEQKNEDVDGLKINIV